VIVYSVAAAGVVMDVETREQRFHLGHGDDVSALVGRGEKGRATLRVVCLWRFPKHEA
jgi:hypothetical protein